MGTYQFRFIRGQTRTNREFFGDTPPREWPEMEFQVYSEARGQIADAGDTPEDILRNCWNTAGRLVTLALATQNEERPLFPSVLITPEGKARHELQYPTRDVLGFDAPGGASRFITDTDPATAHHLAKLPLIKVYQAQFRTDYLRTIARYPDHIVIELDCNQ